VRGLQPPIVLDVVASAPGRRGGCRCRQWQSRLAR
jgi:hypothetical protein